MIDEPNIAASGDIAEANAVAASKQAPRRKPRFDHFENRYSAEEKAFLKERLISDGATYRVVQNEFHARFGRRPSISALCNAYQRLVGCANPSRDRSLSGQSSRAVFAAVARLVAHGQTVQILVKPLKAPSASRPRIEIGSATSQSHEVA